MKAFDTIIFDFGGVILPIDFERTIKAFQLLGMDIDAKDFSFVSQNPIFDQWDRGLVNTNEILTFFRSKLPVELRAKTTESALISGWNAILGRIPSPRLELLKKLPQEFPLFLLSNTNHLHIDHLRNVDPLMAPFENVFQKTYFSYEMKMRKPDSECFLKVVNDQGLIVERTLFVDDHPKNIEAAKTLGFQTLHCTGEITQLFD